MIANSNFLGANTSHNTNLIFVEKEILAEYGHFIVKMLSLQKKQNVCKRHITSYSYQSKKGGIKKAILITRLIKLKMNQFKEEECSCIPGLERQWKTAFPQHIIRTTVISQPSPFFPNWYFIFLLIITNNGTNKKSIGKLVKRGTYWWTIRLENFKDDISLKFSELNDRFNDYQAKYEMANSNV